MRRDHRYDEKAVLSVKQNSKAGCADLSASDCFAILNDVRNAQQPQTEASLEAIISAADGSVA